MITKTEVIEQNLHTLIMSHERFLGTGMKHIKLKETDTVIGALNYLESIYDNMSKLYQPEVNDDYNLDYEFYSTVSKIKLLLGIPTDFTVSG